MNCVLTKTWKWCFCNTNRILIFYVTIHLPFDTCALWIILVATVMSLVQTFYLQWSILVALIYHCHLNCYFCNQEPIGACRSPHKHVNSWDFWSTRHIWQPFSLWALAQEHSVYAAVVLSTAIDVNVEFPTGSTSDATGRTCALSMAPLQRLSIPCHLVALPALPGQGHFSLSRDRLHWVRAEKGAAKPFELVTKIHRCHTLDGLFYLLILFFLHSAVETGKEQPILRGKEVEGKLLIGYTEHSCVLLFPPQIPFVRSAEHCTGEAAPENNTYCKHWRQDLQREVTFLRDASDSCKLTASIVIQNSKQSCLWQGTSH